MPTECELANQPDQSSIILAALSGSSSDIDRLVSSVKRLILQVMSLIKMRNTSGPNIDACGTPADRYLNSDVLP